jgi:hypothetical protein
LFTCSASLHYFFIFSLNTTSNIASGLIQLGTGKRCCRLKNAISTYKHGFHTSLSLSRLKKSSFNFFRAIQIGVNINIGTFLFAIVFNHTFVQKNTCIDIFFNLPE